MEKLLFYVNNELKGVFDDEKTLKKALIKLFNLNHHEVKDKSIQEILKTQKIKNKYTILKYNSL